VRRGHRSPRLAAPVRFVSALLAVGCVSLSISYSGSTAAQPPSREPAAVEIDREQLDRLRSIGYVGSIETGGARLRLGLLGRDPKRLAPGLTFYTSFGDCRAMLVDSVGREVRSWHTEGCKRWGHSVLLPDGDVLAIHYDAGALTRQLVRFSWGGTERWRRELPVHHDAEVTPSGEIATLLFRHRMLPELAAVVEVRDNAIALLDLEGRIREEVSLIDLFRSAPEILPLEPVAPRERSGGGLELDLLHANSVEWMSRPELARRDPFYAPHHVLVSLRHQDAIVVIDWRTRRPVWAWGRGELSGPHDATWLSNGNILIFDNGIARQWSRVVELDPLRHRIVWEYRMPDPSDFYTLRHGSAQRLANGNTLIAYSEQARVFEVTAEGEIVWDFRSRRVDRDGAPIVVYRARRLEPHDGPPFTRSD
jgi:hypothetical protein